ncbi:MAG TPA: M15 family metallopeptidase, partial [Luteimonas sp.]|nr:M15 family metallopeptidase [Luteimonas sp.]
LHALGLDDAYGETTGLPLVAEPDWLALAGFDRYRRPLWLHVDAAHAWRSMHAAALRDDVVLEAISGYRSHDYQLGIFERKLARGLMVTDILAVNAAPGYSEHHSGRALDIGAPDEPAAEESFERTPAFAWLRDNAASHGFGMSYPRDNPHGIVYEPWHWCWQPRDFVPRAVTPASA